MVGGGRSGRLSSCSSGCNPHALASRPLDRARPSYPAAPPSRSSAGLPLSSSSPQIRRGLRRPGARRGLRVALGPIARCVLAIGAPAASGHRTCGGAPDSWRDAWQDLPLPGWQDAAGLSGTGVGDPLPVRGAACSGAPSSHRSLPRRSSAGCPKKGRSPYCRWPKASHMPRLPQLSGHPPSG